MGKATQSGTKKCEISERYSGVLDEVELPHLPSIVEIKKTIPSNCFEPQTLTSLYYMIKDFILVVILYLMSEWSWEVFPPTAQLALTPVFWYLQGTLFTAIFVVGHDAGHGSFSKSNFLNDLCGNICHTFLFCPYFMWKLSHRNHHKNTGNIDKEEVYYPTRQSTWDHRNKLAVPGFALGIGWFIYLIKGYRHRSVYHFNPCDPMFRKHVMNCVISLVFLAVWAIFLFHFYRYFGLVCLLYHWVVPVLVFACYIVVITFLHHTAEGVPWYSDDLWSNVRGQLSSVDREYGWCHHLIHHIGTHQIHHLFPKIPHYHLEEATASFQSAFPHLKRINIDPILPEFFRMYKKFREQSTINDNSETLIHIYK